MSTPYNPYFNSSSAYATPYNTYLQNTLGQIPTGRTIPMFCNACNHGQHMAPAHPAGPGYPAYNVNPQPRSAYTQYPGAWWERR
ncbi:hypothetical protein OHC33_006978 [Knufia fluminis]|uniref:Uncharacterized protein n=1 Tax=Knufia fluminis TaxID=191047 RepID=A0AAN8F5X3_9EURO|nr:hypothetical protein OHC33_006978 [Knufia fluminis]